MYSVKQDVINQAFAAAGFDDVSYDEVITARRGDGSDWEVVIDRGGQLKATLMRTEGRPVEKSVTVLGRKALALSEKQVTTTVMFKLGDAGELGVLLAALEKL